MYTRENSRPLVECRVRRLTRSGATSIPSDVDSATRPSSRSILSSSVPPLHVVERRVGGGGPAARPRPRRPRRGIAWRGIGLAPEPRQERAPAEPLDHLVHGRG